MGKTYRKSATLENRKAKNLKKAKDAKRLKNRKYADD